MTFVLKLFIGTCACEVSSGLYLEQQKGRWETGWKSTKIWMDRELITTTLSKNAGISFIQNCVNYVNGFGKRASKKNLSPMCLGEENFIHKNIYHGPKSANGLDRIVSCHGRGRDLCCGSHKGYREGWENKYLVSQVSLPSKK